MSAYAGSVSREYGHCIFSPAQGSRDARYATIEIALSAKAEIGKGGCRDVADIGERRCKAVPLG